MDQNSEKQKMSKIYLKGRDMQRQNHLKDRKVLLRNMASIRKEIWAQISHKSTTS